MGIGVIVEGVGDVFAGDGIADGLLRILVVLPVAHENQVVGILTDNGHNLFGVSFNFVPGDIFLGLVEKFKDDVVVLTHFWAISVKNLVALSTSVCAR